MIDWDEVADNLVKDAAKARGTYDKEMLRRESTKTTGYESRTRYQSNDWLYGLLIGLFL